MCIKENTIILSIEKIGLSRMDLTLTVYQREEAINARHVARRGQDVNEGFRGVFSKRGPGVLGTPRVRNNHRVGYI